MLIIENLAHSEKIFLKENSKLVPVIPQPRDKLWYVSFDNFIS